MAGGAHLFMAEFGCSDTKELVKTARHAACDQRQHAQQDSELTASARYDPSFGGMYNARCAGGTTEGRVRDVYEPCGTYGASSAVLNRVYEALACPSFFWSSPGVAVSKTPMTFGR